MAIDDLLLPRRELDPPLVFLARGMLGEETRPAAPIRAHLNAVFVQTALNGGRSPADLLHRCRGASDDARVSHVQNNPQLVDAAWVT